MSSLRFFESYVTMPGGSQLPVRSTLVILNSGQRLLISPLNFSEAQLTELRQSSPTAIIAPNCFHHLFVKKAAANLKVETLMAAPGLQTKRADIKWSQVLTEENWPYQNELAMISIGGSPKYGECVFFHKESKTLIVTDLLFNLKNLSNSFNNWIFRLMGSFNKTACSRLLRLLMKDKISFQKDIQRVLEWDFDTIVMAHGEIIYGNAKPVLLTALRERNLL